MTSKLNQIEFCKYSATGNDFIIMDNRHGRFDIGNGELWKKLCQRRLNIGADGVILLQKSPDTKYDFVFKYANADGGEVSMCGNGTRAITHFAHHVLHLKEEGQYSFLTNSGPYASFIDGDIVKVQMLAPKNAKSILVDGKEAGIVDTGVPHVVFQVPQVDLVDVDQLGRHIRHLPLFSPAGTNVNFYQKREDGALVVRTYERGVEGETLSCGTGNLACAFFAMGAQNKISIHTRGGEQWVEHTHGNYFLVGSVDLVFKGRF